MIERVVIAGFVTVNVAALLCTPLTVTRTVALPLTIPDGTRAVIDVLLQFVTEATTPANWTVLVPWVEPKLLPVITTEVPVAPEVGFRLEMTGAAQSEPLARMANERNATSLTAGRREQRKTFPLELACAFRSLQARCHWAQLWFNCSNKGHGD